MSSLQAGFWVPPVAVAQVQVTVTCHFDVRDQRVVWIKPKLAEVNPSYVP